MINLTVRAQGIKQVRKRFTRINRVLSDQRPTMRRVRREVYERLERHVSTRGSGTWAPLEPKYRAWRLAVTGHDEILVMDRSNPVILPSVTRGPFHVTEISRDGLSVGTAHPFAVAMHTGGVGPFGEPFPGRALIRITDKDADELVGEIAESIQERVWSR